jgi:hypothetical protein
VQYEYDQWQRGSQHAESLKVKGHGRASSSSQDKEDPYPAKEADLGIVRKRGLNNRFSSVSVSFRGNEVCECSCEVGRVNADATSATKSSILQAECQRQTDHINFNSRGDIPFGVDFKNPNFAKVAEAMGAKGIRIEEPGDVREGPADALARKDGPVVVDAVVDPFALSLPSHVPFHAAKGFTLSIAKQVLSGRLDSVIKTMERNVRLV